ncbi:hypothetical protein LSH36_459g02045 [Paralvinella palmiformis]|uniref:Pep3/Vps18 beta-propeller domain-containing protein n=1 Tax=Paralvinella palmiformis TaxID=53620 RepID=A0AAD9JA07_9ANNE|nr:hypothetical protein LSH36_459g02045 [Paralvinella palmiformis]
MANLFDQYEQAATRSSYATPHQHLPEPVSTGFINASLEDDIPIFNRHRVNYNPKEPITHLKAANNFLVMAFTSNILNRRDMENPNVIDEVELPKSVDDRIYNIYLDPTGSILETEINSTEESKFFQASLEQYVKQLFDVGKDKPVAVTGIEFERIPTPSANEYKYFIIVTTPGRFYQFLGNIPVNAEAPIFQHVFGSYIDEPERCLELPGNFGYSELRFYHDKYKGLPKSFAWMTGPGIYFGMIDVTGQAGHESVTIDTKLIPYPRDEHQKGVNPVGLVITEFHVLILFPDSKDLVDSSDNPAHLDKVLTKQAEYLFSVGKYIESAETYAQTQASFEEVTLKFIKLDNKEALKTFLLRKLICLRPQDKTQLTMLISWLVEIYLNQLGQLKEEGEEMSKKYEDYERVITHHLQHENHNNALEVLSKHNDVSLFYKFSPVFMQNIPKQTVDAWIAKKDKLEPKKLIPALVQYDHERYRTQVS